MDDFRKMQYACYSKKNISMIIEAIGCDIKLNEKIVIKCEEFIRSLMSKYISGIKVPPEGKDEIRSYITQLNKKCVSIIVGLFCKKYPELKLNRKKKTDRESIERNLDVHGRRENHFTDRPKPSNRRGTHDDDFSNERERYTKPKREQEDEIRGAGDSMGNYASAFGDTMITNIPIGHKQQFGQNFQQRDQSDMDARLASIENERSMDIRTERPPTPDFSLDGSGAKQKQERMMRRMQESGGLNQQQMGGGSMGMDMYPGMGADMDNNPYAALLGDGAPQQQDASFSPFMGMGNSLMPVSSTNITANNLGMHNMNNFKESEFNQSLERMMADRKSVDYETNQKPIINNSGRDQSSQFAYNPMIGNQMMGNQMMPNPMMGNQMMQNQMMTNPMMTNPMQNQMMVNPMMQNPMMQNQMQLPNFEMPSYQNNQNITLPTYG